MTRWPPVRAITAAVLMISAACWLGGCDSGSERDDSRAETNSVQGVTPAEIVLGTHIDLSGPAAILGVPVVNGARMYFDEVNAAGGVHGRQIRWVVEDSQYQVPRAIQAVNKLVRRDKVFAMILSMGTPMNNAVMPMLFDNGIPNLGPLSGARSMHKPFRKLQITVMGFYYDEIRAATRYFIQEQGKTRPCVIYQDSDYGQETLDGVLDELAAMGLAPPAAVSAHKPTETEFTSAMLRLRNAGCDLVLMGTIHKDTILILEAAQKMGWKNVAWVGNNATYSQSLAELASGASEGYYAFQYLKQFYRDDPLPEPIKAWMDRYVERFGHEPDFAAAGGYRGAELIVKALQKAGPHPTPQNVIEAIESFHDYTDFFGFHLSYGPDDHDGVDSAVLQVVKNGRWHTLSESISY